MAYFRSAGHGSRHAIDISAAGKCDRLGVHGFPERLLLGFDLWRNLCGRGRHRLIVVRFGNAPGKASQFTHGSLSVIAGLNAGGSWLVCLAGFRRFSAAAKSDISAVHRRRGSYNATAIPKKKSSV